MKRISVFSAAVVVIAASTASVQAAGGSGAEYTRMPWTFAGFRGHFDQAQLQRGFQVFKEVCSSCHSLSRMNFRNLAERGGPGYSEEQAKAAAAEWLHQIPEPNADGAIADRKGNIITRPARASDPILGPYQNEAQARAANNGALPPDLSIITKARTVEVEKPFYRVPDMMLRDILSGYQEAGHDYLYALLTGYKDVPRYTEKGGKFTLVPAGQKPAGSKECASIERPEGKPEVCNPVQSGMNFNTHYAGYQIGMAAPLSDGLVKYAKPKAGDGLKAVPETVDQYARDVTTFLAWTADPKLEERKRMGMLVMLYLAGLAALLFIAKKRVWNKIPH
jgi:ubiquinol-cytochrome c reductase cytochrome c1 subunit